MKYSLPVHPFLFGLFPVLNLLAGNVFQTDVAAAIPVAAIVCGFVLVILAVCLVWTKDLLRTGLVVTGIVIFFFSPYHAHLALQAWLSKVYAPAAPFSTHAVSAAFFAGIASWIYFFSQKASGLGRLNRVLNIVSICLVAIPIWKIAVAKLSANIDWPAIHRQPTNGSLGGQSGRAESAARYLSDHHGSLCGGANLENSLSLRPTGNFSAISKRTDSTSPRRARPIIPLPPTPWLRH